MNEKKSVVTFKNGKKISVSKSCLEKILFTTQDNKIDFQVYSDKENGTLFAIRFSEVICIE